MIQSKNFFMQNPGGENEGSSITSNDDKKTGDKQTSETGEGKEKKSFIKKIHDALQDWSNEDQREQEFDDTRP